MHPCTLLLLPALVAQAQAVPMETPLSAAERTEALAVLAQARDAFLKSLEGLTPAQRAWQPAPDRWSIDQCAEHIAVADALICDLIVLKVLGGPRDPGQRAAIRFVDGKLLPMILDRSHKAQAPEILAPKARYKTGEAEANFKTSHAALEAAVTTSSADWRGRVAPHPFFGVLDAYQWTLLTAGHTLRHVAQIEEVKASPGFPAK